MLPETAYAMLKQFILEERKQLLKTYPEIADSTNDAFDLRLEALEVLRQAAGIEASNRSKNDDA